MKKNIYATPETEVCLLNISSAVMQEEFELGSNLDLVSGGTINSNYSNLWEEDNPTPKKNRLWDEL